MTKKSYTYETPVEPERWVEPNFHTDHAFSIAVVGDPQRISLGDYYQGTKKMEQLFGSIASTAKENGIEVLICAAGKAAHLGGVIAAMTTLPVIGLPVKTDMMGGLDSLLSIVQMPSGIPVATVGVNGGENAGLLALQILGIKYPEIEAQLVAYKAAMREKINADDKALQELL